MKYLRKDMEEKINELRIDMSASTRIKEPTVEQLKYLNSMLNSALSNQENRYLVVGYIVGRHITTTYDLSRYEASCLIDELAGEDGRIDDRGTQFIRAVEVTVEECPLPG